LPTITPFLWFNDQAEQAAEFYCSIFKDSKVLNVMGPKKKAMGVTIRIQGQDLILFNGGPQFKFTPAFSLMVTCINQEEVDDLWERLSEGGEVQRCGWVKDKYGLNWQVIPSILTQLMGGPDPAKAARVREAMLRMGKIEIQVLMDAAAKKD
jgi:predicted 3-demethylubiquinone-9 3-methyltransferase (glyoxalase superfamily)